MLLGGQGITVDFPGVRALDSVSITIEAGEVVGVVGANGSGKTTLLTVLCGIRQPSAGTLIDAEGPFALSSPHDALRRGVTLVPSEPQLATTLTCWENLTLGHAAPFGVTLGRRRRERAIEDLRRSLPFVSPRTNAGDLRKSDRALLGLLVALRREPRVLALDEPTAVLGEAGVEVVADAIKRVRDTGGAVVLVSHRLRDILRLATKVVVLVDGRVTYLGRTGDLTPEQLVEKLTAGRPEAQIAARAAVRARQKGGVVLGLKNVDTVTGVKINDLEVRAGQILGVAGLSGSGRSRLLRVAAGDVPSHTGMIRYRDGALPPTPHAARRAGIAYVAEDRVHDAMFAPLSVTANLNAGELANARSLVSPVSARLEARRARALVARYGIKAANLAAPVATLSSGNQQRVVLARELSRTPSLLVADEPTQGVDSGGRIAIHSMLRDYAADGGAVLMATSDFEELRELCDRVVVLRDGELVATFDGEAIVPLELLGVATGATLRATVSAAEVGS